MSVGEDGSAVGTYEVGLHSVTELVVLHYLPSECGSKDTRWLGGILLNASARLFSKTQDRTSTVRTVSSRPCRSRRFALS